MHPQAITVISRKSVCRNAVFAVFLDHIRDIFGREVKDYFCVEPVQRTEDDFTGIAVLPVVQDQIGLIRIFRHPLARFGWEVPRGFIDKNESPKIAAARELREETGLITSPDKLQSLGALAPDPGLINGYIRTYKAKCDNFGSGFDGNELGHSEVGFFKTETISDMILRGEIFDPCTLVCCLKFLLSKQTSVA